MDSLNIYNSVIVCDNLNSYEGVYNFLKDKGYKIHLLPVEKLNEISNLNILIDKYGIGDYRLSKSITLNHINNKIHILDQFPSIGSKFKRDIKVVE